MTNINKTNSKQKDYMAQFMVEHSNLAKNIIPNCSQGKAKSKRLWEQLTVTLNSYGPPIKDSKSWRKVFADQKFNAKKKVSFNKASKKKTGGGPYEEMVITSAEEQIIQASGLDVAVEGLSSVTSFGKPKTKEKEQDVNKSLQLLLEDEDDIDVRAEDDVDEYVEKEKPRQYTKSSDSKLTILKSHIQTTEEHQRDQNSKHDHIVSLKEKSLKIKERMESFKERSLKIKEEEHTINMALKKVDLEKKTFELEMLKQKYINNEAD